MAKKQFKTESKRILDLMINSIYTHREIFLRELISNASDAIDKLCYVSLTDEKVGMNRDDFKIVVKIDKDNRRITVSDNGIGMNGDDLENNLGIIARSGSGQFKSEMEKDAAGENDIDIIGQFGVGFYSAFMVGKQIAVISKKYGEDQANYWVSAGADGYTIKPCEKETYGTDIVIELKDNTETENYDEFLEKFRICEIIKKYSDYVRWPIELDGETVNSRVPIWQRSKSEVSDEECVKFYKERFFDQEDPTAVIRINAEGTVSYKAMLFIPSVAPFNYYTTAYKPGLQLYTSGVMIMDKCSDLLPDCFRFVQGVVDSQDLSLNISREMLQHDRQLKVIGNNLEKKVKAELKKIMADDREKYEKFFHSFGMQLKYGIVDNFGMKKDLLGELLLFWSSKLGKMVSLEEYVKHMPLEQKYIYFAVAETTEIADGLPQTEPVKDKGYDILYMTENVDEFVVQIMGAYMEKEFKSVNDNELGLETEDEKKDTEKAEEENKDLLDFVCKALDGKIVAAKVSHKLKSHPVCLATQGSISLEMEKYFNSVPTEEGQRVKAERVLELNANHPVFMALKEAYAKDHEKATKYCSLLYDQAVLIAGGSLANPAEFASLVCELMI